MEDPAICRTSCPWVQRKASKFHKRPTQHAARVRVRSVVRKIQFYFPVAFTFSSCP